MSETYWILARDNGETINGPHQNWYTVDNGAEEGHFYSVIDQDRLEVRRFPTMDAASVYAAIYGAANRGFAPRCVCAETNQIMGPTYHGWICERCGRSHRTRRAVSECCQRQRPMRRKYAR